MSDDNNLRQELLYDDFLIIQEEQHSAVELAHGNIDTHEAPMEEEKKGVPMDDQAIQEMEQNIFETPTT